MKLSKDCTQPVDEKMAVFATRLFNVLREMDDEATSRINGYHAGLCDYAGHCGISTRSYEVPIYRALACHLTHAGFPTVADQPYPYSLRLSCDLVTRVSSDKKLWLEVKQAWKCWFSNRSGTVRTNGWYRSYLFGPRGSSLSRSHSAAQDFDKLDLIRSPEADHVALLLIGLESAEDPMDAEIARLMEENQLRGRGWSLQRGKPIPDRNCRTCQISAWLFWKQAVA